MPENILFPGTLENFYSCLQILFHALLALLSSLLIIYIVVSRDRDFLLIDVGSDFQFGTGDFTIDINDRRPAYADEIRELLTFE
jgi:hypothetical protein